MLRQSRHGYAAGLPRGLPTGIRNRLRSRPPTSGGRALLTGPYPPGWSRRREYGAFPAGSQLRLHLPVSLAGPGPSGGADPSRRCRGCSHPRLRPQARAAPSFKGLLRQAHGGVLSPPPGTWRLVAHPNVTSRVGTALAGGPPRRSQRAELPHWAPGSGQTSHGPTPRRDVINAPLSPAPVRRTRSGTCGTLTRLCVRGVSCRPGSPRLAPFPPPPPRPWALFGGFVGTTRRSDFPRSYISGVRPRPSLSGPTPISGLGNRGISRFSRIETPCMQRFSDRVGSADGSRA